MREKEETKSERIGRQGRLGELLLLLVACGCWICGTTHAFTAGVPLHKLKSYMTILSFAHLNNNNDFDGIPIGDDNEAGQALALEFSKEVQLRQEQARQARRSNDANNGRLLSQEELRFLNRKPFARREEFIAGQVKEIGNVGWILFRTRAIRLFLSHE